MAHIIAVANQKGGTGKTTTTLNLGASLVEAGRKVLLIDFDPQAALTLAHGLDAYKLNQTIYDVLVYPETTVSQVLFSTKDGPDLVPANIDLAGAEVDLLNEIGRELFLKEKLEKVRDNYNFILIDCPPSLGLLTINAFTASDEIIIPVETQYFALKALQQLLNIVKKVKAKSNRSLEIAGFLPTMYQSRTRHCQEVLDEMRDAFGEKVYDVIIKRTVKFPDSVVVTPPEFENPPEPRSILRFDPQSEHAEAYRKLAVMVMS